MLCFASRVRKRLVPPALIETSAASAQRAARASMTAGATAACMAAALLVGPWGVAQASAQPTSGKTAKPVPTPATAQRGLHHWRTLSPGDCTPLDDAEQARLPVSWKPFAAAVRRCDLVAPAKARKTSKVAKADKTQKGSKSQKSDTGSTVAGSGTHGASGKPGFSGPVTLLSVFAEDYYRGLPADTPWADFPRPLLVDATGRCLGALPELYPIDEPRTLTLRHGDWLDGIPQEIRVQVTNPATASGDYALPTLHWDAAQQRYVAEVSSTVPTASCPE